MLIDLTDVFTSEGKVKSISVPYGQDRISYSGNEYPVSKRTEITLTLTNLEEGSLLLEGSMELALVIPCDRCLGDVEVPFSLVFTHQIFSPEALSKKGADASEEDAPLNEEQNFVSGCELDTDVLINGEILVNMPVKVLCSEECKGICPVCGHNLNEGECGCDRFVPDPRMAVIKDIFYANKEV